MSDIDHGAGHYEVAVSECLSAGKAQKTANVFAALDGLCEIAACTCGPASESLGIEPGGASHPPG